MIPENILAVMIGSGITLLGIFLQGLTAFVIMKKQKAIDKKHAQESRKHELKKDNYIKGLQGLVNLTNEFIEFTKPGKDIDEYGKSIQKHFLQLCALELIAEKETIEPIHNFEKYFFKMIADLMIQKMPVEALVIDQKNLENWYNYYTKKIEENITLIKKNDFTGTPQEQEYIGFLNSRYEELCAERDRYYNEINNITQQIFKIDLDFKRKAAEKILMVNQFIKEFVQSARNDLGLSQIPIDVTQVNTFHENIRTTIDDIIKKIECMNSEEKACMDTQK